MFRGCNNLINLNISNLDTNKVKRMNSMFYDCINNRGDLKNMKIFKKLKIMME